MHVRPAASRRALKRSAPPGERVCTTTGRAYTSSASDTRHADTTGERTEPVAPLRSIANASSSCSQRWIRAPLARLLGLKHGPGRVSHDHALPDRLAEERQRA